MKKVVLFGLLNLCLSTPVFGEKPFIGDVYEWQNRYCPHHKLCKIVADAESYIRALDRWQNPSYNDNHNELTVIRDKAFDKFCENYKQFDYSDYKEIDNMIFYIPGRNKSPRSQFNIMTLVGWCMKMK